MEMPYQKNQNQKPETDNSKKTIPRTNTTSTSTNAKKGQTTTHSTQH